MNAQRNEEGKLVGGDGVVLHAQRGQLGGMIVDFLKGLSADSVNFSTGSIIFLSLPYEPRPYSRPPRLSYPRPLIKECGIGAQGPRVSLHMSAMTSSPPSRSPGRIHNPETKAYPTRRSRCILFSLAPGGGKSIVPD